MRCIHTVLPSTYFIATSEKTELQTYRMTDTQTDYCMPLAHVHRGIMKLETQRPQMISATSHYVTTPVNQNTPKQARKDTCVCQLCFTMAVMKRHSSKTKIRSHDCIQYHHVCMRVNTEFVNSPLNKYKSMQIRDNSEKKTRIKGMYLKEIVSSILTLLCKHSIL